MDKLCGKNCADYESTQHGKNVHLYAATKEGADNNLDPFGLASDLTYLKFS